MTRFGALFWVVSGSVLGVILGSIFKPKMLLSRTAVFDSFWGSILGRFWAPLFDLFWESFFDSFWGSILSRFWVCFGSHFGVKI